MYFSRVMCSIFLLGDIVCFRRLWMPISVDAVNVSWYAILSYLAFN